MIVSTDEYPAHTEPPYKVPPIGQMVLQCVPIEDADLSEICDTAECCFCDREIWVQPEDLAQYFLLHPTMHLACHHCYIKMHAIFN